MNINQINEWPFNNSLNMGVNIPLDKSNETFGNGDDDEALSEICLKFEYLEENIFFIFKKMSCHKLEMENFHRKHTHEIFKK